MQVPSLAEPTRLDVFLVTSGAAPTRSQAKSWVDSGCVLVDGRRRKAGFALGGGETVEVAPPREPPARAEPEELPLEILYEDDDVLAINKAPGMVVHPAPGAWRGTVVNALLHRRKVAPELAEERPGIVHRLDRETSGVLLVARTLRAQDRLSRAFHDRQVKKAYLAFVLGVPRSTSGTLEWAIGRHPHERKRMSIRSRSPRAARTHYRLLEEFGSLALLRLEPETGRTHQIRVHLAAMGHPVLADPVYGARKGRAFPARGPGRAFPRQALHAAEIDFPHPASGAVVHVEAPLPSDMAKLLGELRSGQKA